MDTNTHSKLIMAVVQEDDYDATVSQLNKNGFFVTMLSSTGGFWKKKNITIMPPAASMPPPCPPCPSMWSWAV